MRRCPRRGPLPPPPRAVAAAAVGRCRRRRGPLPPRAAATATVDRVTDACARGWQGTVFVTFNTADAAATCAADGSLEFEGEWLLIDPAPPPDQVIWENLQVSKKERYVRQLVSTSLLLLLSVLGMALITSSTTFKPHLESIVSPSCVLDAIGSPPAAPPSLPFTNWSASPSDDGANCRVVQAVAACELGLFESLPSMLVATVFIIVGHIIIIAAAPIFSVLVERPHFFYQRELSVFLKLAFFQVRAPRAPPCNSSPLPAPPQATPPFTRLLCDRRRARRALTHPSSRPPSSPPSSHLLPPGLQRAHLDVCDALPR
jgi:hypothetical protein